ncbi:MAG: hypothetical protein LBN07_01275 [Christensenellaceae bacterium]|jgi:hypothetical protein|nr:hypothetical protein [Christensenellaceae bacterium]
MAKQGGSCLGTLLKILLGIVITVVILVVIAYLVLRFAFGIDVIDIYKKVNALRNYDESKIVDSPYTSQDLRSTADKLDAAGLGFLYTEDAEGNISIDINAQYFDELEDESQWQGLFGNDLKLSGPELAAVVNNIMRGMSEFTDFEIMGLNVNDLNFQLKQVKFSDLVTDEVTGYVTVNFNIVASVDIAPIKELIEEHGFGFANRWLPDKLYISSTNTITQIGDCDYTVEHAGVGLNNLDAKGTQELFDLIGRYADIGNLADLNQPIGELFANILIGNTENPAGFVYLLTQPQSDDPMYANASRLADGFTFEEIDGVVNFVIKRNPEVGQIGVLISPGPLFAVAPLNLLAA